MNKPFFNNSNNFAPSFIAISICIFIAIVLTQGMVGIAQEANTIDTELTLQDFSEGVSITPNSSDSIQLISIPNSFYKKVLRQDLSDSRIFNASGELIPHTLFNKDTSPEPILEEISVPLYHLPVETFEEQSGGLSVRVAKLGEGEIEGLELNFNPDNTLEFSDSYIVDQSAISSPQQLRFDWLSKPNTSLITEIHIETSDDLNNWQKHSKTYTFAELQQGSSLLLKNTIDGIQHRYLWLKAPVGKQLPELKASYAEVYQDKLQQAIRSDAILNVSATTAPNSSTEQETTGDIFFYDLEGPFNIIKFELEPSISDVLSQITLSSANTPNGPWQKRYTGTYFNLTQNGQLLQKSMTRIAPIRARYWQLKAEPLSSLGSQAPKLNMVTVPDTIAFIARGEAPFTLAYGSSKAAKLSTLANTNTMLTMLDNQQLSPASFARMDDSFPLNSEAINILKPASNFPWSQVVLWAILVLGVGVLLLLAMRLLRQSSQDDDT